jgi:hypothetical protein
MKKCKDLVDDFRECSSRRKQVSCLYVGLVRSAEYIDCSSKLICLHLINNKMDLKWAGTMGLESTLHNDPVP